MDVTPASIAVVFPSTRGSGASDGAGFDRLTEDHVRGVGLDIEEAVHERDIGAEHGITDRAQCIKKAYDIQNNLTTNPFK